MEADPELWVRKATRAGSLPLCIIWSLAWNSRIHRHSAVYGVAFTKMLRIAPFSRWSVLHLSRVTFNPPNVTSACFENLEVLKISPRGSNWDSIMCAVTQTAMRLRALKVTGGWSHFKNKINLNSILSRVSNVDCDHLPADVHQPNLFPANISKVTLRFLTWQTWKFIHVTHLDIRYFRQSRGLTSLFTNVETLNIAYFLDDAGAERMRFPQLRTLKWGAQMLENLKVVEAPKLDVVHFTQSLSTTSTDKPVSDYVIHPTSLNFDGGIEVKDLVTALSVFPQVKAVTALLRFATADRNAGILSLQEYLTVNYNEDWIPQVGCDTEGVQKFPHVPDLVTLRLILPSFDEDYSLLNKFITDVFDARCGSSLHFIQCIWEDGREMHQEVQIIP